MDILRSHGWLEMIVGPMYSGKSEELIRRVRRAEIAKQKVVVFKPSIDDRYSREDVVSHCGERVRALSINSSEEIFKFITEDVKVVAIDEIQFFEKDIIDIIKKLTKANKRVICAGLDMDFKGEPFGSIPDLLAIAEYVQKVNAICVCCGNPATRTQRLINGVAANYSDPIVLIGAKESYEARCVECYIEPQK
ncbi:thymidine kinase [Hathewaya histolytica]|uniref:Thymidine kinase n=1 Tax=Hathewaya histolytica TaxID=1498 RepID=A0A4U9RT95_HATHI|nr:thymidine kinase [Hathewaya histolytica]VTQ94193.1 thymidine kinase [Hathewaya histolytica]